MAILKIRAEDNLSWLGIGWVWGYWTSTSWDGDSKDSAGEIIDLSAAFGMSTKAQAVLASLTIKDASADVWATLSQDSSNIDKGIAQHTQVANVYVKTSGIVPCDSNGDIYWKQKAQLDYVYIRIIGYLPA